MFVRKLNTEFSELNTSRLILKKIRPEDSEDIFQIYYDYDVIRFTDSNLHFKKEDSLKFIESISSKLERKDAIFWGLYEQNQKKIIGTIGLYHIDHKHFFASIGVLLNRKYWRQGYMYESLRKVIPFAFNHIGLNRIEAQMYVHHEASINLFEKLRFTREAILRENFQIEWKMESSYMYSLLKSDFEQFREFYQ